MLNAWLCARYKFSYYYYILQIIYVILEETKLLFPYPPHLKNFTALPCKMHNFFIWLKVCGIPPNVGGSEKDGCGLALVALKRTGCDVWQMECQASNATANVQSDHLLHGYMLPVFFATDQLHRPPRSAEIQPMSQQDASATRLYRALVLDTREINITDEKFMHFVRYCGDIFHLWWVRE